jgi:hypothetical protein
MEFCGGPEPRKNRPARPTPKNMFSISLPEEGGESEGWSPPLRSPTSFSPLFHRARSSPCRLCPTSPTLVPPRRSARRLSIPASPPRRDPPLVSRTGSGFWVWGRCERRGTTTWGARFQVAAPPVAWRERATILWMSGGVVGAGRRFARSGGRGRW